MYLAHMFLFAECKAEVSYLNLLLHLNETFELTATLSNNTRIERL